MDVDKVDFLTNEHSKTLEGLHREIQKLQCRCSELTFKLHFSAGDPPVSEGGYEKLMSTLETIACLRAQLEDVTQSLGTELHHKTETINELENQLLEAQKEITVLSGKQRNCQSELDSKTKTIGFLSATLKQIRSRLEKYPLDSQSTASLQKIAPDQRRRQLHPISSTAFFSEEEFQSPCFRSLPPSFDPLNSPKIFVPTPPAELPKNRTSYPRYHRRYSAPRLRPSSANDSLPLALLPEEKIHLVQVPSKQSKKLILPPIPNATRESQSKNGPIVCNLQSPQTFKHPPKATRSTPVKEY